MKMIDINKELSQNFLDFSYEANCQRAFADARDGLKPGQRACLWEMYSKGYTSNKPHVKSAKISGGTIATWWPHGDVAVYDTFARMSQPWINNIPEVDWHGANGSIQISGEAASSRYTEARLAKSTEDGMFFGMNKNNVPMKLNFSEDAEWPVVLPAIYPRLMVNGCQGIGSTIANVWLSHNCKELGDIIISYLISGILDYDNLAPDFPTGGVIINKNDLKPIYETGKGKVVLRAKTTIEDNRILVTEIPYQVYVEPLIDSIKKLIMDGSLTGIDDIVNKSDRKRLLIEIECNETPKRVLDKLFRMTDLQKSYSANQYALVGKTPELLNLKSYLDVYINHNLDCILRENQFDYDKMQKRKEIVEGLLKALEDIDNIITLIKKSESSANAVINLQKKYNFTELQAKAIVDMKLGRLARLESIELNKEKAELEEKIANALTLINNVGKRKEVFITRLQNFIKKYGTNRRTELTQIDPPKGEEKEIANVEPEKCIVVLTESGYIKRMPTASFRAQRRNTKGVKTQDDITSMLIRTNTIDSLMIFSNKGKMYRLLVDDVPVGNNTTKGTAIKGLVEMGTDEQPTVIYSIYRDTDAKYVIFVTKNGIIKKTSLDEYTKTKKKSGIAAITLKENDELCSVFLAKDEDTIITTKDGFSIRIDSKTVVPSGRITMGTKGITLREGDYAIAATPVRHTTDTLAVFSENGMGKRISLSELPTQSRGGKGLACYKPTEATGNIAAIALVEDTDDLLISGNKTNLCISASEIPILGRASIGNIIIKGSKILSVSKV